MNSKRGVQHEDMDTTDADSDSLVRGLASRRAVIAGAAALGGYGLLRSILDAPEAARAVLGPWGGYANGEIPVNALMRIDYPGVVPDSFPGSLSAVYLKADAGSALLAMLTEYHRQTGGYLRVNEGYRTLRGQEHQWQVHNHNTAMAAVPGTSNHGYGQAVDFEPTAFTASQQAWVRSVAATFGYSGSQSEVHHFDYTGTYTGVPPTIAGSLMALKDTITTYHNAARGYLTLGPGFYYPIGDADGVNGNEKLAVLGSLGVPVVEIDARTFDVLNIMFRANPLK